MEAAVDLERERLEREIRAHPRDLDRRRALGTYLEQQGDPFGEFLHWALLELPADHTSNGERTARCQALLAGHAAAWFPTPPWESAPFDWGWLNGANGRGFVDRLMLREPSQLAWWAEHYPLREVWIFDTDAAAPLLHRLAAGSHVGRLESLVLSDFRTTAEAWSDLAHAAPGLSSLVVGKPRDPVAFSTLLSGPMIGALTHLRLADVALTAGALCGLWLRQPPLTSLELLRASLPPGADLELPDQRRLAPVELSLEAAPLAEGGEDLLLQLWGALDLRPLRSASLPGHGLSAAFLTELASCARGHFLDRLEVLDLSRNGLTNELVPLLVAALPPNLAVLDLRSNYLDEKGASLLAAAPSIRRLRELRLNGNSLYSDRHEEFNDAGFITGGGRVAYSANEIGPAFGFPETLRIR